MKTTLRRLAGAGAGAVAALAAWSLCACTAGPAPGSPALLGPPQIAALVASSDRTSADRANDARRKPAELLAFIGVRPGATALDLSAGGGYTTELLARAIGPTGTVYAQRPPPRDSARPAPAPAEPEGGRAASMPAAASMPGSPSSSSPAPAPAAAPSPTPGGPIAERAARLRAAGIPAATIVAAIRPFDDPVPPEVADGRLDLATLLFNYHDFGFLGVDRARLNAAVFRALKPGGTYVVADHAGRPGTGISESGTLHRIEPAFLRREVEAAGFRLADEGRFLANPSDPRDRNQPDPPQPKDEFVLKFVKP